MKAAIVRIDFDKETPLFHPSFSPDEFPQVRHRDVFLVFPTREHLVALRDACRRLIDTLDHDEEPYSQRDGRLYSPIGEGGAE